MTKTVVFTLREQDVTAEKVGGNVTTHVRRRIIEICITYPANCSSEMHKNIHCPEEITQKFTREGLNPPCDHSCVQFKRRHTTSSCMRSGVCRFRF